mmetsp:Transcript_32719/g.84510  ORF Transcript_32719/g.84510 Transcript_32719/m.84510 type:complete len:87 (-) Transcript_32719:1470-1730(-)
MAVTLHTSHGDMKCEIHADLVPKTAENFLALCASGYYDGTLFHRNIRGFMVQGGDPTGYFLLSFFRSFSLLNRKGKRGQVYLGRVF